MERLDRVLAQNRDAVLAVIDILAGDASTILPGGVEAHSKTLRKHPDQDSENERNRCGKCTRQTIQDAIVREMAAQFKIQYSEQSRPSLRFNIRQK